MLEIAKKSQLHSFLLCYDICWRCIMLGFKYEQYNFEKEKFPVILTKRTLTKNQSKILAHWHMNLEILIVLEGSLELTLNLEKMTLSDQDVFIIQANTVHSIESLSSQCVFFRLLLDGQFAQSKGYSISSTKFLSKVNYSSLNNIVSSIYQEMLISDPHTVDSIQSLTCLLIIELYRSCLISENKNSIIIPYKIDLVQQAIEIINQNFLEEITLDYLASNLSVSKSYFCRIFKEITTLTSKQYINEVRCKFAQELLLQEEISIEACSVRSGFNSSTYFSKCYKNSFGYPPIKTREKNFLRI